jgi:hypothetical protein
VTVRRPAVTLPSLLSSANRLALGAAVAAGFAAALGAAAAAATAGGGALAAPAEYSEKSIPRAFQDVPVVWNSLTYVCVASKDENV